MDLWKDINVQESHNSAGGLAETLSEEIPVEIVQWESLHSALKLQNNRDGIKKHLSESAKKFSSSAPEKLGSSIQSDIFYKINDFLLYHELLKYLHTALLIDEKSKISELQAVCSQWSAATESAEEIKARKKITDPDPEISQIITLDKYDANRAKIQLQLNQRRLDESKEIIADCAAPFQQYKNNIAEPITAIREALKIIIHKIETIETPQYGNLGTTIKTKIDISNAIKDLKEKLLPFMSDSQQDASIQENILRNLFASFDSPSFDQLVQTNEDAAKRCRDYCQTTLATGIETAYRDVSAEMRNLDKELDNLDIKYGARNVVRLNPNTIKREAHKREAQSGDIIPFPRRG